MSNEFIALDVETANETFDSICQIGYARFKDGAIIKKWVSLIDPEEEFSFLNVMIHGISEGDVKGKPKFYQIFQLLVDEFQDLPVVHHTSFDRAAFNQACIKYGLPIPEIIWLDSAKIVRRAWDQFHYKGYGLANVADFLGIKFNHHDALEDAITAGMIVVKACQLESTNLEYWLNRTKQRITLRDNNYLTHYNIQGNIDGILFGENMVFTGAMTLSRNEATIKAGELGCNVRDAVSKETTILVVGTQDIRRLKGEDKSSKHRKAEELIKGGQNIKIISETDFMNLLKINS